MSDPGQSEPPKQQNKRWGLADKSLSNMPDAAGSASGGDTPYAGGVLEKSMDPLLDKALSIVKVTLYIVICFATSYFPLDLIVRYGYFHMPEKALFMFLVSSFELILALALLYLCAKYIEKKPFLSYGFKGCTIGGGVKETFAGVAMAAFMVSLVMLILYLTGCYQVFSASWNIEFLTFLPWLLVAAMREEVMFRGYVLQTLEKSWGTIGAIFISSVMFGFLHMINFEPGVELPAKIYSCMCLSIDAGLVFAVAYLINRRLWFPFGMHVTWNVFEGPVYGTLVSSLNLGKPLLQAKLSGPFYLTGGVFGPEASLVEVCVCLLLVAFMWRRAKLPQIGGGT